MRSVGWNNRRLGIDEDNQRNGLNCINIRDINSISDYEQQFNGGVAAFIFIQRTEIISLACKNKYKILDAKIDRLFCNA